MSAPNQGKPDRQTQTMRNELCSLAVCSSFIHPRESVVYLRPGREMPPAAELPSSGVHAEAAFVASHTNKQEIQRSVDIARGPRDHHTRRFNSSPGACAGNPTASWNGRRFRNIHHIGIRWSSLGVVLLCSSSAR